MMSFKTMSLLALVGLSQASPITSQTLEHDDVLVLRDGKALVMKSWDYTLEEDKREVQRRKMGASVRDGPATKADRALEALKARGCDESTEVQVLTDTHFNDWDVAMSPVIGNTGSSVATIAVAEGYSIADSVSVTETVSGVLEKVLTLSLAIAYSETWTTTETQTFSFNVPAGQYGVVVSNPYVHRVTGNVISGCTDSPTTDAFTTDSYSSETYGSLSWVTGPIVLCNSTTYPIPYCVGTGSHE